VGANHQCVAGNSHGPAKFVTTTGIGCLDIGLLAPHRAAEGKYIHCPGIQRQIITLIAIDAGGVTALADRTDHQRVTGMGYGKTK